MIKPEKKRRKTATIMVETMAKPIKSKKPLFQP